MFSENNAELIDVGEIKISTSWTNLYLKFKFESGNELWLYYSEHAKKPLRLCQIKKFLNGIYKVGDRFTVNYKIIQSNNKSNKLSIIGLSNHCN